MPSSAGRDERGRGSSQGEPLSPPLMHAFRAAHAARDAKKQTRPARRGRRADHRQPPLACGAAPSPSRCCGAKSRRDLEALMNTIASNRARTCREFDHVRSSILNFGLPDIAHRSIDEIAVDDITQEIDAAADDLRAAARPATPSASTRDSEVDAERAQGALHRSAPTCSAIRSTCRSSSSPTSSSTPARS